MDIYPKVRLQNNISDKLVLALRSFQSNGVNVWEIQDLNGITLLHKASMKD